MSKIASPLPRRITRLPRCQAIKSVEASQREVLQCLERVPRRGQGGLDTESKRRFESAVEVLEEDGGLPCPASSELLIGCWKLLFTSVPGTESPIQKTFTGIDAFNIYQDIVDDALQIRLVNRVDFGPRIGELKVEAEVSTQNRPIPGFVPRQGEGLPFFGKTILKPPPRDDCRLDIWFDQGAFDFAFLPFKIPYPVPFRLFGDETKAWFDVTYLSRDGTFRLTRGSKGTLFVLTKEKSEKTS